jgi:hypothetical protein
MAGRLAIRVHHDPAHLEPTPSFSSTHSLHRSGSGIRSRRPRGASQKPWVPCAPARAPCDIPASL